MTPPAPWSGRRYAGRELDALKLPVGGIGTGTVSVSGRGALVDWEVRNRPAKGVRPDYGLLCLSTRAASGERSALVLEGELAPPYEGARGIDNLAGGLPRFERVSFEARYPFGRVLLSSDRSPLEAELEVFNPLVPGHLDDSSIPALLVEVVLRNPSADPVEASVAALCSPLPEGGSATACPLHEERVDGVTLVTATSEDAEREGELGLYLLDAPPGAFVEAAWPALGMKDALVGFWDAFAASGRPPAGPPGGVASIPLATVGAPLLVPPGGSGSLRFVVAWRFPNRLEWPAASLDVSGTPAEPRRPAVVGNRYAGRCASAAEVAGRLAAGWDRLRARSLAFSASVLDSDLPPSVAEAALDTLVALRSETSFVTADGWFAGWEGTNDDTGSCHGSCTHVWNYEWATPLLFSELARSMRAGELERATGPDGHMSFRIGLTPESARRWQLAAADGQLGAVVKLYREWQLSGDRELLERLWPAARRALSYAWGASGWDRSGRGIADGCLHHTLDVEYIGPNPLVQFWYLAALRAGEELAGACGDEELAAACRGRFEQGSRFADDELFNGSFYAQRLDLAAEDLHVGPEVALDHWILDLRPPGEVDGPATAAATSRSAWLRAALRNGDEIPHQLGPGCLADQLAGEVAARLCGLGRLADPTKLRSAAAAVAEHNRVEQFRGVANPYRTYALNDDAGLVVAAYPHGGRPSRPAPYFSEVFSGFEYTAAAAMILHGLWEEGVRTVDDVRARYAGWNRNPFDEAECGHHYARSMASWAVVLAITGFWYSAPNGRVTVALRGARSSWPWSTGSAFGTVLLEREPGGVRVELAALEGSLAVREVVVCEPASGGEWALSSRAVQRVEPGAALVVSVTGPAAGEETAADGAAGEETAADGATASARRAPSST